MAGVEDPSFDAESLRSLTDFGRPFIRRLSRDLVRVDESVRGRDPSASSSGALLPGRGGPSRGNGPVSRSRCGLGSRTTVRNDFLPPLIHPELEVEGSLKTTQKTSSVNGRDSETKDGFLR